MASGHRGAGGRSVVGHVTQVNSVVIAPVGSLYTAVRAVSVTPVTRDSVTYSRVPVSLCYVTLYSWVSK